MQPQSGSGLSLAVRIAQATSRLLTWGMPTAQRRRLLAENLADWEAMSCEHRSRLILWRALRGVPAAVWVRLNDREITAMPAGVALSMVGLGGMASGLVGSPYPAPFRQFLVVTCLGLVLVGLNFIRDPRRVVLVRFRAAGLCIIVGFIGLAVTLPTTAQWPYEGPVLEHIVMDRALQAAFVAISVGFLLLLVASVRRKALRLVSLAGILLMSGTATIGVTQVAWGVTMAPVDLAMTAASIVIGLGALSFTHVLPRLRHLDFVFSQADWSRRGEEGLRKGGT